MAGGRHRRACAFDPHDPDIALTELCHERAQLGPVDVEAVDVQDHRPPQKEACGPRSQIVKPRQPVLEGQLRRQCKRKKGPPLEADRLGLS
jgi:hypothetical protein